MLRAVLFDLDDTLIDQQAAAAAAVVAWAAEHDVTDSAVRERWASISQVQYARYSRREISYAEQRRRRVREFLGVDVDDQEADELFAGYRVRYEAGWVRFDDAVPVLRRARSAGLVVAVLTNGEEAQQRLKLHALGLDGEIDVVVASSMLPAGKPDPRAFTHALELIGVAPREALMVGDSLENDVRGATAAGLDAILLDRHGEASPADCTCIRSLDELTFGAPRAL